LPAAASRSVQAVGVPAAATLTLAGQVLVADPAGAIYWPARSLLAVADLHLEKGSSFAERRILLPPYDTAATLARMAKLIARYAPETVVALGDSFHDRGGASRLDGKDRASLVAMQRGRDWIWIAGNHDPEPPADVGGRAMDALTLDGLTFRHLPAAGAAHGEIAGHLHPVARVVGHGRAVSRRCFATDGSRMVLPAFGAYAGGLNVRDRAFASVFDSLGFTAHLLGERRVYAVTARQCLPDR
jgi:DNA ligase-associated metallophosphoesterase